MTLEMVKVRLAVKSQCDKMYVRGITPEYLPNSSMRISTFSFEASNLAVGINSLTAYRCNMKFHLIINSEKKVQLQVHRLLALRCSFRGPYGKGRWDLKCI